MYIYTDMRQTVLLEHAYSILLKSSLLLYLHEVTKALLTEHIFEENQVLFMVCIRVELRGEQGQSLMQAC